MKNVVASLAISTLLSACGGSADSTFAGDPPTRTPFGGSPTLDPGAATGAAPVAESCSAAAKLVYVVSQEKELYSFAPDMLTFKKIGTLACPGTTGVPASMAVDRSGTAWVNYATGGLYKVSTTDASCTDTGFAPGQQDFLKFGMAFASATAGAVDETLYVSGLLGQDGKGFGKVDVSTLKLTMLGQYSASLAGRPAELTGTGDGRVFGFFATAPSATLARIDPTKGATSSDASLGGVTTGNAFAFSFWGGDFWFYTTDGHTPSQVTRRTSEGAIDVVMTDVGGFKIVGAGVSTCAPLTYPH